MRALPNPDFDYVEFEQAYATFHSTKPIPVHPVPVASVEYIAALFATWANGGTGFNISLTAIDHMAPSVLEIVLVGGIPVITHI